VPRCSGAMTPAIRSPGILWSARCSVRPALNRWHASRFGRSITVSRPNSSRGSPRRPAIDAGRRCTILSTSSPTSRSLGSLWGNPVTCCAGAEPCHEPCPPGSSRPCWPRSSLPWRQRSSASGDAGAYGCRRWPSGSGRPSTGPSKRCSSSRAKAARIAGAISRRPRSRAAVSA
jgi:hypothetical protein